MARGQHWGLALGSSAQCHSHRNFTVCRNYTNLVSQCDQLFPFCGSPTYQLSKYLTTILTNSLREVEENGKLPFLGCLVSRDDNSLRTTVYRKPIYTDRLMDESSYNPTSHRATAIRTLTRRSQLVCNTTDSLSNEKNYFHRVFQRTITTKTSFNVTLTDLLLLPRITTTQILRLQQLYCT